MVMIRNVLRSLTQRFQETLRYTRGGAPIPEAMDRLEEFLSNRDDLSSERWVSDTCRDLGVSADVAVFAFEFFSRCNIPIGKLRPGDRLTEDLRLNEVLRDEWDLDLQVAFARRFNTRRLFRSGGPRIVTVSELLLLLQEELGL